MCFCCSLIIYVYPFPFIHHPPLNFFRFSVRRCLYCFLFSLHFFFSLTFLFIPLSDYSNPIRPAFGLRTVYVKPSNFCSMQKQVVFKRLAALCFFMSYACLCLAQGNGTSGIMQATSMVSSYFDPLTKLIYAVGAVVGLIGGIKVYQKFVRHEVA